jgi:hypothetical protein
MKKLLIGLLGLGFAQHSYAAFNYVCASSTDPTHSYNLVLAVDAQSLSFGAATNTSTGTFESKCEVNKFTKEGLACYNMGFGEDYDDVIGISQNLQAGLKSADDSGTVQERSGMAGDKYINVYTCKNAN